MPDIFCQLAAQRAKIREKMQACLHKKIVWGKRITLYTAFCTLPALTLFENMY